jgi:hypothetical protein
LDLIDANQDSATLTIPLRAENSGPFHLSLVCRGFQAIEIFDTEHIGIYDIQTVTLNSQLDELTLIGNIPIRLVIELCQQWELFLDAPGASVERREWWLPP